MLRFISHQVGIIQLTVSISIHLMLRFILACIPALLKVIRISIHLMLRFIRSARVHTRHIKRNFNTSNVKVYHSWSNIERQWLWNFNTSNVKVYHNILVYQCYVIRYFNTSNVKVYLVQSFNTLASQCSFQYI